MVFRNSSTHPPCQKALYLFRSSATIIFLFFFLPSCYSLYFNFSQFGPNTTNITNYGDAFLSNQAIELTENKRDVPVNGSTGRAVYSKPVHLWDSQTGRLTDFTTHFSFIMNSLNTSTSGDGLAFFLAANGSYIPPASAGGQIGLFSSDSSLNSIENQLVAVEFDSYKDEWDPSADHIGINVNSIVSKANVTWRNSIKNGSTANAWVSYNSSTKNLSVFLTYAQNPDFGGNSSLYYLVDLREMLPEWINIGFSAATRTLSETHQILSWNFTSTLEEVTVGGEQPKKENNKRSTGLVVRMVVGGAVLIIGLGSLLWFGMRRSLRFTEDLDELPGVSKFTHNQLVLATNNFSEDGKLGEGSFGSVYKGFLCELNLKVAVKRVSRGSTKGKKEYLSMVKIISQLHHRNLVQLLGWCHERGDFLLVYEFMPNGSLASHLFGGKKSLLPWALRHEIAKGLAFALLYLHEAYKQCVVPGDIKSSNVMLGSDFKAKLGSFHLARLVGHGLGSETSDVVLTIGYSAPECFTTGKASEKSDVYSFGVVALEIACGRRAVELEAEESRIRLVKWVRELYERGNLLDAADQRLNNQFDEEQMERLMLLGLLCTHSDPNLRPSMNQVIVSLDCGIPLPSLPSKTPMAMDFGPQLSDTIDTSSNSTDSPNSSATDSLHSSQTDM